MTYRLTRDARDDVAHIFREGLRLFGLGQADKYHEGLEAAFRLLADYPRAVRQRNEIDPPVRAYRYQAHMIIYKLDDDDTVIILGVRHSHEDWINRPV